MLRGLHDKYGMGCKLFGVSANVLGDSNYIMLIAPLLVHSFAEVNSLSFGENY